MQKYNHEGEISYHDRHSHRVQCMGGVQPTTKIKIKAPPDLTNICR